MRKKVILIGIIVIIFICLIIILIKTGWLKINVDSSQEIYSKQNSEKGIISEKGNLNKSNNSENLEDVLKTSGEEGGISASGGETSNTKYNCDLVQVSYSLKNFESNEECLQEEEKECILKQINCTIEINNLDENSGSFELNLVLFDEDTSETIESINIIKNVGGKKSEKVFWSFKINENNSPRNLHCAFKTTLVPKKEVCI